MKLNTKCFNWIFQLNSSRNDLLYAWNVLFISAERTCLEQSLKHSISNPSVVLQPWISLSSSVVAFLGSLHSTIRGSSGEHQFGGLDIIERNLRLVTEVIPNLRRVQVPPEEWAVECRPRFTSERSRSCGWRTMDRPQGCHLASPPHNSRG